VRTTSLYSTRYRRYSRETAPRWCSKSQVYIYIYLALQIPGGLKLHLIQRIIFWFDLAHTLAHHTRAPRMDGAWWRLRVPGRTLFLAALLLATCGGGSRRWAGAEQTTELDEDEPEAEFLPFHQEFKVAQKALETQVLSYTVDTAVQGDNKGLRRYDNVEMQLSTENGGNSLVRTANNIKAWVWIFQVWNGQDIPLYRIAQLEPGIGNYRFHVEHVDVGYKPTECVTIAKNPGGDALNGAWCANVSRNEFTRSVLGSSPGELQAPSASCQCLRVNASNMIVLKVKVFCESGTAKKRCGGSMYGTLIQITTKLAKKAQTYLECFPGYFLPEPSGDCTDCPMGWIANASHNTKNASGVSSCYQCTMGKQAQNHRVCVDCPMGFISASTRQTCDICPAGKYMDDVGSPASECKRCAAGEFSTQPGADTVQYLLPCPSGEYQPGTGSDRCFPCTGATEGATTCAGCGVGSRKDAMNETEADCVACGPGKYSDKAGVEKCTFCPSGFFNTTLKVTCDACPAGRFMLYNFSHGAISSEECQLCPMGLFNPAAGALGVGSCKNCPAGFFNAQTGASTLDACSACDPGKYSDSEGATDNNICKGARR
jgi:hypothetical protein